MREIENKEKLIRENNGKKNKGIYIDILLATILSALKALNETLISCVVTKCSYLSFLSISKATKSFTYTFLKHVVKIEIKRKL